MVGEFPITSHSFLPHALLLRVRVAKNEKEEEHKTLSLRRVKYSGRKSSLVSRVILIHGTQFRDIKYSLATVRRRRFHRPKNHTPTLYVHVLPPLSPVASPECIG